MTRNWQKRALLVSVLALTPAPLWAADAPAADTALTNLGDKQLMNELVSRGLDSLLDRYFQVHQTPEADQQAIRSMEAMRDLSNPNLSNSDRDKKVRQIVDGLNRILPTIKDPFRLAENAAQLLQFGVTRDANLLEYWGPNPTTEANLRPVAEAVYKMLGQASKEAAAQANAMAGKINAQNQNIVGAQWQKLDDFTHTAEYSQNMMAYFLALSLPKAERGKVVDQATKYLQQFDDADSTVMPRVHVMMGKLALVKGDYATAIKMLGEVANKDKKIVPPPGVDQQYEAKYFENVARMEAGKIKEAKDGLEKLIAWQKSEMPHDAATQKGISAAAEMLRYRIDLAEADRAKDPTVRKNADAAATEVLLKLSSERPDLRGIIYQQLIERLPKDAPVKGMDPLLLQGLMAKAYTESTKPQGKATDKAVLKRGVEAATEVTQRPVGGAITPQVKDEAARLIPVLLETLGDKVRAANAYLDYAKTNAMIHPDSAQGALQDAGRLTFELRRSDNQDPQVSDLYDRFLPVAINPPFNRKALAYFYAQRLSAENKPLEAMKYFHMVAKDDKNYDSAQYYLMKATQSALDNPKMDPTQRSLMTNELVRQAEQVRQLYSGSTDTFARERAAIATLVAAETTGADQKKPAETIRLLNGFEDSVKGTPDEKALIVNALLARVNAEMELGKLQQATDTLVSLLNHTGGAQGAEYVHGLLNKLDKNLDRAEAAHDTSAMRDIARSEADLSGFLVDWARNNASPEIKKYTYQYMVFDARTKRLAGALAENPADRKKLLDQALDAYKRLQQPQNVALYKATLDQARVAKGDIDPNQPDPNVQLGIGLTDFELKDYKDASELLGLLLNSGKLGGATLVVRDPTSNEEKVTDNDVYWDATYKLYASYLGMAKGADDPMLDPTKQGLKNLLIRGGIPEKWQDHFEDLRKKMIPEFSVAALTAAPTSQPTAQATGGGK